MAFQKKYFFSLTGITLSISLMLNFALLPVHLLASPSSHPIPLEKIKPEYWIKKIKHPTERLFTLKEIHQMNDENTKKQELGLFRIKDLKKDWRREEVLSFLKEDWKNFGKTEEVRFGKKRIPLGESFWSELETQLNIESLKENINLHLGLIVKRTDIRVFPTDEASMSSHHQDGSDLFQHSSISPGSPIGIYHFSKNKEWAYVQTSFIRGWVRTRDLAIAKQRNEVLDYENEPDRLVVIGNKISIFDEPSFRNPISLAQMGDTFPLFISSGLSPLNNTSYAISLPSRKKDGGLILRKGYIRVEESVHRGFLPYTQENIARQAFKMLDHPYGWGDQSGGRDCSRLIMDLFRTFGFLMPRNSKEQALIGKDLGLLNTMTVEEKQKILHRAIPLATTLRCPNHIMLYLGEEEGNFYVIHSIGRIQQSGNSGIVSKKIGKVVVSDLNLGSSGPQGSLLQRLSAARFVGLERRTE